MTLALCPVEIEVFDDKPAGARIAILQQVLLLGDAQQKKPVGASWRIPIFELCLVEIEAFDMSRDRHMLPRAMTRVLTAFVNSSLRF